MISRVFLFVLLFFAGTATGSTFSVSAHRQEKCEKCQERARLRREHRQEVYEQDKVARKQRSEHRQRVIEAEAARIQARLERRQAVVQAIMGVHAQAHSALSSQVSEVSEATSYFLPVIAAWTQSAQNADLSKIVFTQAGQVWWDVSWKSKSQQAAFRSLKKFLEELRLQAELLSDDEKRHVASPEFKKNADARKFLSYLGILDAFFKIRIADYENQLQNLLEAREEIPKWLGPHVEKVKKMYEDFRLFCAQTFGLELARSCPSQKYSFLPKIV